MDELTDAIAADLQRGDRHAWSRLYEAHAERLWCEVARVMGGKQAEVADVVQEVFLAAAKLTEPPSWRRVASGLSVR